MKKGLTLALGLVAGLICFAPGGQAAGLSVAPSCVVSKPCRACNKTCLNRCRRALKRCRQGTVGSYKRCIVSVPGRVRSCYARAIRMCKRTCRGKGSNCQRTCVKRMGSRCSKSLFQSRCRVAQAKKRNSCKPTYRKCSVKCCRKGVRMCKRKRLCRKVNCIRSKCPPVCKCMGALQGCSKCRVRNFRLIR